MVIYKNQIKIYTISSMGLYDRQRKVVMKKKDKS